MNLTTYGVALFTGILFSGIIFPIGLTAQENRNEIYYFNKGKEALASDDFPGAVKMFKKADSLRANHPVIMQYLAQACSRAGLEDCTFKYLEKLGRINANSAVLQDAVFDRWRDHSTFRRIQKQYEEMNRKVTSSDTAFVIPERDLHPESVVIDPRTRVAYIGSIRKRKIVKRGSDGSFKSFRTGGLLAASGMKIDTTTNSLWVASPAVPEMMEYDSTLAGSSYVLNLDLDTGELIQKYGFEDGKMHFIGDLFVQANKIYLTDSRTPAIYEIDTDEQSLKLLKLFEHLRSLQGITGVPNGGSIYFTDYIDGIFQLDPETGEATALAHPPELSLKGIDGLYYYNRSLIAVQNGIRPMRITRLFLDETGTKITHYEYLEKNNPVLDEPTLGTIVDGVFYYVANSPWGKYDQEGNLPPADQLDDGLIMKIKLK